MIIIDPSYEILSDISDGASLELKAIERAARTCYKSEDRITEDISSAKRLIKNLIDRGHEAMLEHSMLSVKFICSRAISHELVRHRIASFAQESQRYCNYSKEKFDSEVTMIRPIWVKPDAIKAIHEGNYDKVSMEYVPAIYWNTACSLAEEKYFDLLNFGLLPEEARDVLPNSTKTEIVVSANYREWRNILSLRTSDRAHPEMRRLMVPLLNELHKKIPVIFDDIEARHFEWEEKNERKD